MAIQPESSPSLIDRFLHIIESAAASDRFLLRLALFVVILLSLLSNYNLLMWVINMYYPHYYVLLQ